MDQHARRRVVGATATIMLLNLPVAMRSITRQGTAQALQQPSRDMRPAEHVLVFAAIGQVRAGMAQARPDTASFTMSSSDGTQIGLQTSHAGETHVHLTHSADASDRAVSTSGANDDDFMLSPDHRHVVSGYHPDGLASRDEPDRDGNRWRPSAGDGDRFFAHSPGAIAGSSKRKDRRRVV